MTGLVIELVVAEDLSNPNAARVFRTCPDVKTILQNAEKL